MSKAIGSRRILLVDVRDNARKIGGGFTGCGKIRMCSKRYEGFHRLMRYVRSMRGNDEQQGAVFSYINPEERIPSDHPLRSIRAMVDGALHELVFGVPHYHIINAAFTHARPEGSRFNGADRGAWYAGFSLKTAQAEVAFHYAEGLREVNWQEEETVAYREYLADFRAEFHDLRDEDPRGDTAYKKYLRPDSYRASQQLARRLLDRGSAGVVYPSVRHAGGTCIACFRPALVGNVREGALVTLTFPDAVHAPKVKVSR